MKEFENKYFETEKLVSTLNNCLEIIEKLNGNQRVNYYPIAFFEIFVDFQILVYSLFEMYCLGKKSSAGYCPERKHPFSSEIELRAFLKTKNEYIDYDGRIEELSEFIFLEDPFSNLQCMEPLSFSTLKHIRNYIAHKSNTSLKKLENARIIREDRTLSEYFASIYKKKSIPYFNVIISKIYDFSNYLIEG